MFPKFLSTHSFCETSSVYLSFWNEDIRNRHSAKYVTPSPSFPYMSKSLLCCYFPSPAMGTDIQLVTPLTIQVFYGVISFLDWGYHLLNVSFKCCLCFFLIPSTLIDLVWFLYNFLPFLAFNLYVTSLYIHLSLSVFALASLLKLFFFEAVEPSLLTAASGANILKQFLIIFNNFLSQFFVQSSWAHNHCQCWEIFPLKYQVSILLFWTSCCLHKTRVTKSLLL